MSVFEPLGETISRDGLESNEDVVRMRMLAVIFNTGLGYWWWTVYAMHTSYGDGLGIGRAESR